MNDTKTYDTGAKVRSIYFYVASLVTLGLVVGSLVGLLGIGFRAWVFPNADPAGYRAGPPPEPYITSSISEKTGEVSATACDTECVLSDADISDLENWADNYAAWKERAATPNTNRIESLITALSLLIIALPLFIIHFRMAQKEKREGVPLPTIRSSYFYLVALAALLMVVIAGSIFLNSVLRAWLVPQSTNTIETIEPRFPGSDMGSVTMQTIQSCDEACELPAAVTDAAATWQADYDTWQDAQKQYEPLQNRAATSLPYVLLGIPLFWYHWRYARDKKKDITK